MIAAWYERTGPAREVLTLGEMPDPEPGPGELRIRIAASGLSPEDAWKRGDGHGAGMPYPRVIPHGDGAGEVDRVGEGVSRDWLGERVWCFGAQSGRPFGTAAGYAVVPARQAVLLPEDVSMEQGACLGTAGITGHRAVHAAGPASGRTVLVRDASGTVGQCAIQMACRAGARVVAAVSAEADEITAHNAGAEVVCVTGHGLAEQVRRIASGGVDLIVEADLAANIGEDAGLLAPGGTIAVHASGEPEPRMPWRALAARNISVHFLGSEHFPIRAGLAAARDLNGALKAGWPGPEIAARFPLPEIAGAHELVERSAPRGSVVLVV
jgi:NADPH:quinone reductase